MKTYYRIDHFVSGKDRDWTIGGRDRQYPTQDDAQMAFADPREFPLSNTYRIVEVTERVVQS